MAASDEQAMRERLEKWIDENWHQYERGDPDILRKVMVAFAQAEVRRAKLEALDILSARLVELGHEYQDVRSLRAAIQQEAEALRKTME